ncbi:hypothetical protein FB451DRAFT_1360286 [Mycena latifolia]|nr:hypothetical protein FB451DRAFT_1360286 [Mycena latifolia]
MYMRGRPYFIQLDTVQRSEGSNGVLSSSLETPVKSTSSPKQKMRTCGAPIKSCCGAGKEMTRRADGPAKRVIHVEQRMCHEFGVLRLACLGHAYAGGYPDTTQPRSLDRTRNDWVDIRATLEVPADGPRARSGDKRQKAGGTASLWGLRLPWSRRLPFYAAPLRPYLFNPERDARIPFIPHPCITYLRAQRMHWSEAARHPSKHVPDALHGARREAGAQRTARARGVLGASPPSDPPPPVSMVCIPREKGTPTPEGPATLEGGHKQRRGRQGGQRAVTGRISLVALKRET